jgi:hypothetical protein
MATLHFSLQGSQNVYFIMLSSPGLKHDWGVAFKNIRTHS